LRVYEAVGKPVHNGIIGFAPQLVSAIESNIVEDEGAPVRISGNAIACLSARSRSRISDSNSNLSSHRLTTYAGECNLVRLCKAARSATGNAPKNGGFSTVAGRS
jgi:hypothetical protein